jgi:hypothetical protein
VQGDDAGAPPAPGGDIDLDGGPPLAPETGTAPEGQSPVPDMGDPTGAPVDGAPDGQSPVPTMGGPTDGAPDGVPTTEPDPDGAPMPPTGETNPDDPAPPDAGNPEPGTVDGVPVAPGEERLTAAAVTGWFLDEVDANDPARERMIDLVEQAAADGSITVEELEAAFLEAGFPAAETDGSDGSLGEVIADGNGPRTALVSIDGEGVGLYRVSDHGDIIELESVRTGAVHAAERGAVAEAWRSSGARVISTTSTTSEVIEPPATPDASPKPKVAEAGGGSSGLRNLLLAGGVLLPLAGGGTYLATRKIR